MRLLRDPQLIDKLVTWLYDSVMSDYGPHIERASFDFYATYGDEQETVYSDSGLQHLVYEESPAYLVTPDDVKAKIGEFAEDDKTDEILHQVNGDLRIIDAIRSHEKVMLYSASSMFSILDAHPYAQCTPEELIQKLAKRRAHTDALDAVSDDAEIASERAKIAKLETVLRTRRKNLDFLGTTSTQINLQQNIPLETAVDGIRRHCATRTTEEDPAA